MDLFFDIILVAFIVGIVFMAVISAGTIAIKKALSSRHETR